MIQMQTVMSAADNSGAKKLVCIKVLGGSKRRYARVGDIVIDNVPGSVERWAISTFGENDKPALVIGITVVSLLIGAATGVVASRRFRASATDAEYIAITATKRNHDRKSRTLTPC